MTENRPIGRFIAGDGDEGMMRMQTDRIGHDCKQRVAPAGGQDTTRRMPVAKWCSRSALGACRLEKWPREFLTRFGFDVGYPQPRTTRPALWRRPARAQRCIAVPIAREARCVSIPRDDDRAKRPCAAACAICHDSAMHWQECSCSGHSLSWRRQGVGGPKVRKGARLNRLGNPPRNSAKSENLFFHP